MKQMAEPIVEKKNNGRFPVKCMRPMHTKVPNNSTTPSSTVATNLSMGACNVSKITTAYVCNGKMTFDYSWIMEFFVIFDLRVPVMLSCRKNVPGRIRMLPANKLWRMFLFRMVANSSLSFLLCCARDFLQLFSIFYTVNESVA